MTARIHDNLLKGIFFLILFSVLLMVSFISKAQSRTTNAGQVYRGFVASFGSRSLTLSSDIPKIHQSNLVQNGGQVGLIYGNSIVRSKVGLLGYYSSSGNTAGTTDLYTSNVSLNLYPLSMLSGNAFIVEPYLTGGLAHDKYKFYGYYLNQEPGEMNYSQGEAPFLGKITQVNATYGVGVEVKLKDRFDFIHLFSEYRIIHNLSSKTKDSAFEGTTMNNPSQLVIGISFGAHR